MLLELCKSASGICAEVVGSLDVQCTASL